MRILYCTDTFLPQVNGVSVVTDLSARGLARRGWDVHVVAPQYPRNGSALNGAGERPVGLTGVPSLPLPLYPEVRLSLPLTGQVGDVVRRFAPNLVHCCTEFIIGRHGQRAAERAGIPMVTSYHTDFGRYAAAYGMPGLAGRVGRYLARFHRRARRTFTPSSAAREQLWTMGVENVEVWGRGVDTERFSPVKRSVELRNAMGLGEAFTFLHVGRLAPEKLVHVVIDAFRIVRDRVGAGNARLVIAGRGPSERRLRESAPPDTVFEGFLDRDEGLPALYASADAFVFPSVTETLGLVVLEAMAAGLPVIATRLGGVADHLHNGENGLSCAAGDPVAFADAMLRLIADRDLTRRLAEGGLRTAAALSWDAELDRLDASCRRVCEQARLAELRVNAFVRPRSDRTPTSV